jgi:CBS domain-containing protein
VSGTSNRARSAALAGQSTNVLSFDLLGPRGPGGLVAAAGGVRCTVSGRALNAEEVMRVSELMQHPVVTVGVEASVPDAVAMLADEHISAVPVTDRTGHMVGVVSATDILAAQAEATGATSVQDIMTPRPYTVSPDTDVKEAAQQMLYADVHRLFVTQGDRVVGVVSTTDIVRAVATGRI